MIMLKMMEKQQQATHAGAPDPPLEQIAEHDFPSAAEEEEAAAASATEGAGMKRPRRASAAQALRNLMPSHA